MLFNCDEQRAHDVQNFISTGSNIVRIIKYLGSLERDIENLPIKIVEEDINTIKERIEQFAKVNGVRSEELTFELDIKEKELEKLLIKLQEKNRALFSLKEEYNEYMRYIQYSTYRYYASENFYEYINVSLMTKDEFLTMLIFLLSVRDDSLMNVYEDCCNNKEEGYKELICKLKTVKDVVEYIKENY